MSEKGDKLREAAELADQEEELQERQKTLAAELEVTKYQWLEQQPISSHFEVEKRFAEEHNIGLSEARKAIRSDLKKYEIEGKDIPLMIKELKMYRRTLKGDPKVAVTKSIDNLINAYSST